jgi:hypothetical protein
LNSKLLTIKNCKKSVNFNICKICLFLKQNFTFNYSRPLYSLPRTSAPLPLFRAKDFKNSRLPYSISGQILAPSTLPMFSPPTKHWRDTWPLSTSHSRPRSSKNWLQSMLLESRVTIGNTRARRLHTSLWPHNTWRTEPLLRAYLKQEKRRPKHQRLLCAKVLEEFGLSGKSLTFVTDNAPSMLVAFGRQAWLGCAAHNINLVQKHSFEAPGHNSSSADVNGWDLVEPVCDMLQHAKDLVTLSKPLT